MFHPSQTITTKFSGTLRTDRQDDELFLADGDNRDVLTGLDHREAVLLSNALAAAARRLPSTCPAWCVDHSYDPDDAEDPGHHQRDYRLNAPDQLVSISADAAPGAAAPVVYVYVGGEGEFSADQVDELVEVLQAAARDLRRLS